MAERDYLCGLDLGQIKDHSALAVLERTEGSPRTWNYSARTLHRWPRGTSYPAIVEAVAKWFGRLPLQGAALAVDVTGVGRPVFDMLRKAGVQGRLLAVNITAGHAVTQAGDGGFGVPKRELVSVLQVLLGERRLQVPKQLAAAEVLVKELQHFQAKITTAGNEVFEAWRERDHDDLVLALALAAWWGERSPLWAGKVGLPEKVSAVDAAPPGVFQRDEGGPGPW